MQSWYSGDLRVLYIPHSELSYPPASKIQSPDPSRSSAMVPSARITQLWPKAITQQITNLTKIKNVPQNHKIQKACQLTENKSINVQLKWRNCSKLSNGVEKIHRNGRRWQAFFLEPNLTQNFAQRSERPETVWSNSPREPIRTFRESRTGMFSKPFLAASESISPFSGPGPCGR